MEERITSLSCIILDSPTVRKCKVHVPSSLSCSYYLRIFPLSVACRSTVLRTVHVFRFDYCRIIIHLLRTKYTHRPNVLGKDKQSAPQTDRPAIEFKLDNHLQERLQKKVLRDREKSGRKRGGPSLPFWLGLVPRVAECWIAGLQDCRYTCTHFEFARRTC